MSLPRDAGSTRRRRSWEFALLLALVACASLVLAPILKAQAQKRAEDQARAEALMRQANEFGAKVKELAPPAVGLAYRAACGAPPDELIRRMAPFELESANSELAKDPDNIGLLSRRARLLKNAGRQQEQLADLDRILELQPDDTWARGERVDLLGNTGRFREAQDDLDVLDGSYHDSDNLNRQAYISVGLGEYQRALESYELLDSQGNGSPEVFCGMAAAKRALGDEEGAWKDIGRARGIDPTYCLHWAGASDPGVHEEPCSKPVRRLPSYYY